MAHAPVLMERHARRRSGKKPSEMICRSRVMKSPRAARIVASIAFMLIAFTACGSPRTSAIGSTSASVSPSASASASSSASVTPSDTATPATWQMLPAAPSVLSEAVHGGFPIVAIWDGREVLMVTKRLADAPDYCDTVGAAYKPATDAWRTLPPFRGVGDCFDPLTWDKAVWDGKEMLIWGTTDAAFNPSTNSWRHLPRPPVPASPAFAVWTGRQMIGWGGGGGDFLMDQGAAYTPATNSWKRLPPAPLEGNGRLTIGAWTGSEVVVAGGEAIGRTGMRFFRDSAAYDPTRNTWRRLAPMPIGESAATAVWDGKDVLLIDAEGPATTYTTKPETRGLAYDPATDRWRWIAGMEYPRGGDASAWTGHHLVVWGGTIGDHTIPPHGEAYDPTMDTWSAMPRSPLRARYAPIAVWTGTSVVFWGGADARNWGRLYDGATFTPASP
jgi:hypothetical protein